MDLRFTKTKINANDKTKNKHKAITRGIFFHYTIKRT